MGVRGVRRALPIPRSIHTRAYFQQQKRVKRVLLAYHASLRAAPEEDREGASDFERLNVASAAADGSIMAS